MGPVNVIIVGTALNTEGFTALNTLSGVGLNTFGFLWAAEDIWTPSAFENPTTTVWDECAICEDTNQ